MAQNLKVSQPYANAFIQMVSGKDSLDKVISDLTYIEAALKSPDLVQAFSNPLLSFWLKTAPIPTFNASVEMVNVFEKSG